ncbi:CPXCG motif-containing cysteine-rich protein [Aliagarivorans marinus]|uniref:CPXCG motif-containing cysteine-rich protein n=1 Tax=Aliagarivorans marinus TaxID=561965 RepID=UPI000402F8E6|nr:CPXCG motif-containing cysteine-rich protein [Aliagarivorans marinus]
MKDYLAKNIRCPNCGHHTSVELDASNGDQEFYEDCHVCCHSIHCRLERDELSDKLRLYVDADDEQIF